MIYLYISSSFVNLLFTPSSFLNYGDRFSKRKDKIYGPTVCLDTLSGFMSTREHPTSNLTREHITLAAHSVALCIYYCYNCK